MKRLMVLTVAVIISFLCLPVSAQVELGIQGGTQLGDVSLDPSESGVETSMKAGLLVGGVLYYGFTPMLGLQIEPAYVQKKVGINFTMIEDGANFEAEGTINSDYFDLPVLFKVTLGEGPVKPYLMTGITLAFLLGDNKLELEKITVNGIDVTNMVPANEREEKLDTKSTDFILNFGGGIKIPVGKFSIFLEGQYNLGLTDVNDDPDSEQKINTRGLQIKAGALFPL